ncbi:MAG: hypothetical protein QNJ45_29130 [Ardenticatenaceae bacterium]|nr:hypothetical protein [Ardenticatenaceae bacterium]
MSSLTIKRIALVIICLIIGLGVTELTVFLIGTTREEYGLTFTDLTAAGLAYYPLTILFIALGVGIWLDKFMNTEILPH